MKKRAFGAVAVVLGSAGALSWSLPASAQEFLKGDRKVTEGPGYQAGDFEIHPGLAAEIGYDSNYLGRSDKTGNNLANGPPNYPVQDTGELRISPSLSLRSTPSSQRAGNTPPGEPPPVTFSLGASGTYREFFSSALQNQRNMSANANASVGILPGHEWNGSVNATYARIIQPSVLGNPDASYNHDIVSANADLATQPNMGTLSWHFGYTFTGTFFEQSGTDSAQATAYNNTLHTGYTRGRWRFRPRTALVYDGQISYRKFADPTQASFQLHEATPVRAKIGLEGLVTPRFSILGMVGYGATLTNGNDASVQQYDSIIGNLELRFFPGSTPDTLDAKPSLLVSTVALGYMRDFQASYLNDFYGIDRGYLSVEYFFAGRFITTLTGGVGAYEYPNVYFGGAPGVAPVLMHTAYTNVGANATLFVEYRILQGLGINATGTYVETFSNTQLPSAAPTGGNTVSTVYDLNMRRITAFLGVRWFM
jgi:hypothetical protein